MVGFRACITGHMTRGSASRGFCIKVGMHLGGGGDGWVGHTPLDHCGIWSTSGQYASYVECILVENLQSEGIFFGGS